MATDIVTGGAVVGGIVAILFALRPYILRKRTEKPESTEERAGFKNTSYWEKRFDKIDTAVATLDRIIRENRQLSLGEAAGLRDLLVEIDTNIKVELAVKKERR